MDWNQQVQDKGQWWAVWNTVRERWAVKTEWNFLIITANIQL